MATTFRALRAAGAPGTPAALMDVYAAGELGRGVLVVVAWSALSRLDALAVTGQSPAPPGAPLGLDLAGHVLASGSRRWTAGDAVLATGCRRARGFVGGLAERAQVPASRLLPLPPGLTPRDAVAIGTPGLAAALAVELLEAQAVTPERGPVFVTGATGGLGSLAVALLAGLGYEVAAITGRPQHGEYLLSLGAARIVPQGMGGALNGAGPIWSGGIDTVGGPDLMALLTATRPCGAVVACGAVAGSVPDLDLAPFTEAGVCLLGCDALGLERAARTDLWMRLAHDLAPDRLAALTTAVPLEQAVGAARGLLAGRSRGRVVVGCSAQAT